MKKRLFKAKLIGLIVGVLELIGVIFLAVTYYFNWFGFKDIITPVNIFISFGSAVILDIVYVWAIITAYVIHRIYQCLLKSR